MISSIIGAISTTVKVGIGIAKLTYKVSKSAVKFSKRVYRGLKNSYQKGKELRSKLNNTISKIRKTSADKLKADKSVKPVTSEKSTQNTTNNDLSESIEFKESKIFGE